jgi:hypothetical protein
MSSVGDTGRWVQSGNILYLYSAFTAAVTNNTPDRQTTFCASGNTLLLSGYHGMDLAQHAGLRTLTLSRMAASGDGGT